MVGGPTAPNGWMAARRRPTAAQTTVRANCARPTDRSVSVRGRKREHLRPFALGEAAPNAVGLVDLQRVSSAGCHRRTFKADSLGLRFPSGPGGSAFPLRMEKERTGHPATGCVQLPVPKVGVRAGKAPGVRHIDPLCSDWPWRNRCNFRWYTTNGHRFDLSRRNPICGDRTTGVATEPGIWARSTSRTNQSGVFLAGARRNSLRGLPRHGRIRADPGAVDLQTLDRFSSFDKSLIPNFVDLDEDFFPVFGPAESTTIQPRQCVIAHTAQESVFGVGQWRNVERRLLSAVTRASTAHFCPKRPLLGPYCRSAVGTGSGTSTSRKTHPSTPSAGGIT